MIDLYSQCENMSNRIKDLRFTTINYINEGIKTVIKNFQEFT